jgi:nucleoid-associated protein YgaU
MQAVVPLQYRPVALRPRRRPSPAVYRRRRIAVLLCAVAVAVFGWLGLHWLTGVLGDGPLTVAEQPGSSVMLDAKLVTSTRTIVQSGDTLWSIARRVQPSGDVRPLVAKLEAQRHGRALQVGETIVLPARR